MPVASVPLPPAISRPTCGDARTRRLAPLPTRDRSEIDAIWDVTKGIPLTADSHRNLANGNVANVTKSVSRQTRHPSSDGAPLHVRDKALRLALLRRPDQPKSVGATIGADT